MIGMLMLACGNSSDAVNGKKDSKDSGNKQVYKIGITQFMEHPSLNLAKEGFKAAFKEAGIKADFDEKNANGEVTNANLIATNYKADKKLHWDYLTDRGICWRVNFKFYDGNNEYWGGIDFNEEEIFNAFGEFSQEEDLKLSIYINKGRSMASVKLTNGKKEVWLTNNKIVINKVN